MFRLSRQNEPKWIKYRKKGIYKCNLFQKSLSIFMYVRTRGNKKRRTILVLPTFNVVF